MLADKIKRAADLVKKTGEKMILFENDNSDGLVVMSLEEYEKMVQGSASSQEDYESISNLTEDELIDKINRNIAIWKNENKSQEEDSEKMMESFLGLSEDFENDFGLPEDLEEPEDEEEESEDEEDEPEEDNFYYYSEDNISYPEVSPQEQEQQEQPEQERSAEEENSIPEEQEEPPREEQGEVDQSQEEIGGARSNWEIPVNIKRNAEEVEE